VDVRLNIWVLSTHKREGCEQGMGYQDIGYGVLLLLEMATKRSLLLEVKIMGNEIVDVEYVREIVPYTPSSRSVGD